MNHSKLIIIIMTFSLFKLFGCSNSNQKKLTENEMKKSLEAFQNRQIYKNLTVEIIDTSKDEDLLQVVFDNLSEDLPKDYNKEYEVVTSWNKSKQAIYVIWLLEGEVNNGGFNQFYFNSSGEFAELLPDALNLVKATKFSDLMRRANSTYIAENDKITEHQDGTMEGFMESYKDNPLDKLDEEFYELHENENLYDLQIKYIREHKNDFIN